MQILYFELLDRNADSEATVLYLVITTKEQIQALC